MNRENKNHIYQDNDYHLEHLLHALQTLLKECDQQIHLKRIEAALLREKIAEESIEQ